MKQSDAIFNYILIVVSQVIEDDNEPRNSVKIKTEPSDQHESAIQIKVDSAGEKPTLRSRSESVEEVILC